MRHSHTSRGLRTSAKALLAIVGLGFAGACADSPMAPTSNVSISAPAGFNRAAGVWTFQYTPRGGATKRLGDHMIVIPADGICDPATSGYGKAYWDAPCNPVNHSIVFTATALTDVDGHPYLDFQPAVRFVPTTETYLYLKDAPRSTAQTLTILYCATALTCVDESLTDPTLVTVRVGKSNILGRRLKHFSGYNIAADLCRTVAMILDDGSAGCGDGGMSRSGYMVASGLNGGNDSNPLGRRHRRADQ